jgi:hypothetical protein
MPHCQICAREIKAKKGYIAHHGYTRPGHGWQTRSCAGAQHLPYEVSRDAIPLVITGLENFRDLTKSRIHEWETNQPATIEWTPDSWGRPGETKTLTRPAEINEWRSNSRGTYEYEYFGRLRTWKQELKGVIEYIEFLNKRYADWKPEVVKFHKVSHVNPNPNS